jgi:ABC-type branched-subunit amino acid transport system substrate-binding protein
MSVGESIMERAQRAADAAQVEIVVVDNPFAAPDERFAYCPSVAKATLFPRAAIVCTVKPQRHEQKRNGQAKPRQEPSLLDAAKVVVALSGWTKIDNHAGGKPREVYQTSYMAIEVLRAAIERAENPPLLQLAPEPLPIRSI